MNKKKNYLMGAIHKRDSPYRNQFLFITNKKAHHQGLLMAPFAVAGVAFSPVTHRSCFSFGLFLPFPEGTGNPLPSYIPFGCFFLAAGRTRGGKGRQKQQGVVNYAIRKKPRRKQEGEKTRCLATRVDNEDSLEKSFYTSYTKLAEIKLITIGLASPERIRRWAEKILPNGKVIGKVTNPNTIHHKTFKPQKGGLFCERIFGPLKDFECACGKTQKPFSFSDSLPLKNPLSFAIDPFSLPLPLLPLPSFTSSSPFPPFPLPKVKGMEEGTSSGGKGSFLLNTQSVQKEGMEVGEIKDRENELKRNYCPTCDVEYTWSVSRRYQLGYIELVEPMTHVWYLKAAPSYLSILLDIKKKHLENVVYGAETMTLENSFHSFSFIKFFAQPDLSTLPSCVATPSLLLLPLRSNPFGFSEEGSSHFSDMKSENKGCTSSPSPFGKGKGKGTGGKGSSKGSQIRTIKPTNYKSKGLFWFSKTESKRLEWSSKWALNPFFEKKTENKRSSSSYLKSETTGASFYKRAINRKQPKETNFLALLLPFKHLFLPTRVLRKGVEKERKDWRNNRGRTLALSLLFFKGDRNKNKTEPKGFFFLSFHSLFTKESSPFPLPLIKEGIGRKKQGELSFRSKNSYYLKSRVSLSKYKLTQKNMVEKAYRRIYSWPGLLARPLLILLSNNKQRINNSLKDDTFKTGIREMTQKFPTELYILSNIERIVRRKKKKSIRLTTQRAWKKLYQKAYKKASLKANQILRKFVSRKANSNKVSKSISQTQRFASFPFVTPLVKEGREGKGSKGKANLGLKSSLNAFSKNIKVNSIKQAKLIFLSRILFENQFRSSLSLSIAPLNKEINLLSSRPLSPLVLPFIKVCYFEEPKGVLLTFNKLKVIRGRKDKPLRKKKLTEQGLGGNKLSFTKEKNLFQENKDKTQHANLKANVNTFIPLNSVILSDTNIRVATQITIEKQAIEMIKEIKSIIHCLTKGLVRIVLPKKAFLPLPFSYPSCPLPMEAGGKGSSKGKGLPSVLLPVRRKEQEGKGRHTPFFIALSNVKKAKGPRKTLPFEHLFPVLKPKGVLLPFEHQKCSKETTHSLGLLSSITLPFPLSLHLEGKGQGKRKFSSRLSLLQKEIKGSKQGPDLIQSWEKVRPRRRVNFYKLVNNVYSLSHRHRWEAGEAGKKDWTSFLEYVSAPIFLTDKAIPKYEYRLNPSPLATLVSYHDESLNYKALKKIENFNIIASFSILKERVLLTKKNDGQQETVLLPFVVTTPSCGATPLSPSGSSHFSYMKSEKERGSFLLNTQSVQKEGSSKGNEKKGLKQAFSSAAKGGEDVKKKNQDTRVNIRGSGLIKALLTELNLKTTLDSLPQRWDSGDNRKTELNKIDKQNRILLYESNKKIYRLKQILVKDTFWDYTLSDKKNKIMKKNLKKDIKELLTQRNLLIRRTKLVRKLFISTKSGQCPSSMVLSLLPVLPPDLRPIVKMGSGVSAKVAATDLNKLYQRVIYRNDNFKLSIANPGNSDHSQFARALLQIAVDNLIQNNKSGVPAEKDSRGRPLKSLSDILKGKQGRFRQYLLGKRVDYSGRSVIIVGPKLKIHQCGIPKEMALELFLPFLLKKILNYNLARTVVGAKALITTNKPLIWELLTEIMRVSPVLLNRAPTLHRLGIQAFIPKLIDGRAILLHPLVCSAFNADFDGDQMAVHVPITVESRAEAWKLMLARNNLLSPATGEPISVPSQDMVLGCYYLTTQCPKGATKKKKGFGFYFKNEEDVLKAYDQQKIDLHAVIWLQFNGMIEDTNETELPIEIRITKYGIWKEINPKSHITFNSKSGVHPLPLRRTLASSFPPFPLSKGMGMEEGTSSGGKPKGKDKILLGSQKKTFLEEVGHLDLDLDEPQRLGFFKLNHYIKTTPGKIVFNRIIKKSINSVYDNF